MPEALVKVRDFRCYCVGGIKIYLPTSEFPQNSIQPAIGSNMSTLDMTKLLFPPRVSKLRTGELCGCVPPIDARVLV